MTARTTTVVRNATPLYEGARALLGYFVYNGYSAYLNLPLGNLRNWWNAGLIGEDGRPTALFRRVVFDFNAFDLEKLATLCALYFHIYASHKQANAHLLRDSPKKRVLYLRGFDDEAAVAATDTVAVGISTVDTQRFNLRLGAGLGDAFELFKALSPKDVYWETLGHADHAYGDYGTIIRAANAPIRSFYLNARHWQADIAWLAPRMDYFVVYVSSITESLLWELHHLIDAGHAARTTVVFDREAILTKNLHAGFYAALPGLRIGALRWRPDRQVKPTDAIDALRGELEKAFTVVSADDFEAALPALATRIQAASGPLPSAERVGWLDFRFAPALDDAALARLRGLDEALAAEIDPEHGEPIGCLPYRINQVLLRVFTALLFGAHRDAGTALAVYAGTLQAALDFYTAAGRINERVPATDTPRYLDLLRDHCRSAADIAWHFLCAGDCHDFGDHTAAARTTHTHHVEAARAATAHFLAETAGPAGTNVPPAGAPA